MRVLGIDPGTRKCGYAVLDETATPIAIGIVALEDLAQEAQRLKAAHGVTVVALGGGTNAPPVAGMLEPLGVPIHLVDERETTLRARSRFFKDHPPRGWRRLVPLGMLLPPRPIDDYAALLIAERFLGAL